MKYHNVTDYQHGTEAKLGILLLNLGTPDAPTAKALRPYLREFLSDTRVVEPPPARWLWKMILEAIILRTRPQKSADAYAEVWGREGDGSPLLDISQRQAEGITQRLEKKLPGKTVVALGMRYGNPSTASALKTLQAQGAQRILVLPLYPQYAAATTASTFDAVTAELRTWRWVPELRFVNSYHKQPGYIQALARSVTEHWAVHGKPQKLVMSYHGIPQRYFDGGDPYPCHCYATSRKLAEALNLNDGDYIVSFQSLFGKEEWIKPYTDATMKALPEQGIEHVQVICPGFSADCLETIEEIDGENRAYFEQAGGKQFSYIAALNDRTDHLDALVDLIMQQTQGWPEHGEDESVTEKTAALANAKKRGAR